MTDERDPPLLRRSGDSPASLVAALEAARGGLPSAAQLERLRSSVDAALTVSDEEGAGLPRSRRRSLRPVAAGGVAAFKLLLAAVVAASGLGAAFWLYGSSSSREPSSTPRSVAIAPPVRNVVPFDAVTAQPESEQAPVRNSAASTLARPAPPAGASAGTRLDQPRPSDVAPPVGSANFADPAATEIALLGRAQQTLATSPATALSLTAEHARSYPGGALTQEREFIAIEALQALGRHDEAVARAAQFRAAYPGSAHLRRLDLLLGAPANVSP